LKGESFTVSAASDAIYASDVAILLLGLKPGAGEDFKALARIKSTHPQLRAIVLAVSASQQYAQASFAAGADFCLDKSSEFAVVPVILRNWVDAARPGSQVKNIPVE
jgi:DNA-binding NarL/FixJ family response regulator